MCAGKVQKGFCLVQVPLRWPAWAGFVTLPDNPDFQKGTNCQQEHEDRKEWSPKSMVCFSHNVKCRTHKTDKSHQHVQQILKQSFEVHGSTFGFDFMVG
jgi:hypothetical protein